jgi:hypothetical protein
MLAVLLFPTNVVPRDGVSACLAVRQREWCSVSRSHLPHRTATCASALVVTTALGKPCVGCQRNFPFTNVRSRHQLTLRQSAATTPPLLQAAWFFFSHAPTQSMKRRGKVRDILAHESLASLSSSRLRTSHATRRILGRHKRHTSRSIVLSPA